MLTRQGEETVTLSNQDVVNIISQQQEQLKQMVSKSQDLENIVVTLQKQLLDKTKEVKALKNEIFELKKNVPTESFTRIPITVEEPATQVFSTSKSKPEIIVDVNVP